MDVTYFAVVSHVNLSHIVQCILAYWFPPRIDMSSVNEGLERAASASLNPRLAISSPSHTRGLTETCAHFKKQSGFPDGQLYSSL